MSSRSCSDNVALAFARFDPVRRKSMTPDLFTASRPERRWQKPSGTTRRRNFRSDADARRVRAGISELGSAPNTSSQRIDPFPTLRSSNLTAPRYASTSKPSQGTRRVGHHLLPSAARYFTPCRPTMTLRRFYRLSEHRALRTSRPPIGCLPQNAQPEDGGNGIGPLAKSSEQMRRSNLATGPIHTDGNGTLSRCRTPDGALQESVFSTGQPTNAESRPVDQSHSYAPPKTGSLRTHP